VKIAEGRSGGNSGCERRCRQKQRAGHGLTLY
jgi:hypothetical protein